MGCSRVAVKVISMACSFAQGMFCKQGSLSTMLRLQVEPKMHELAMLLAPISFGGMNEPIVYMHCCGSYLSGRHVCDVSGMGGVGLVMMWLVWFGIVCHVMEKLTFYFRGMLCM